MMRTPAELKLKLRRQWDNRAMRESRLLAADLAWPVDISIGRPLPRLLSADLDGVKRHVAAWKRVTIGTVIWEPIRYRSAHAPVNMPVVWRIRKPSEWLDACGDASMKHEFACLATLVEMTNPIFHSLLVRRRSLWRDKSLEEVVQAARVAMALEPGSAAGRPLRSLAIEGIDTKFFERHAGLVTTFLNVRFDDEVGEIGLESFLGALTEGEHWLLVIDLDGSLLPFRKQRIRSSELRETMLPGKRLLIIENEKCQHLLPSVPDTIAVLGAGFDLSWTQAKWLARKNVAYWGDIDTWGLSYLAKTRVNVGNVDALMMTSAIYELYADAAVPERVIAGAKLPIGLNQFERSLYERLLNEPNGRLEQEFVSETEVSKAISCWAKT